MLVARRRQPIPLVPISSPTSDNHQARIAPIVLVPLGTSTTA